jgi:glutaminase
MQQAKAQATPGKIVRRIPRLAEVNPEWFAVHICNQTGETYSHGDTACVFPLMSVIKPFTLLYLLENFGAQKVLQWVGMEASNAPFNSLEQLIADEGRPRNPMINSGAITLADNLPGNNASDRTQNICQWLNHIAGCNLHLDEEMLASVRSAKNQTNQALAEYLAQAGYIDDVEIALDTYEQICCLSGQVGDLALLGNLLVENIHHIVPENRRFVNAVMLTCGLYQASPVAAVKIGLPIKSGVSGALLAIVPSQGAIACYSPELDNVGNPAVGLAFLEILSQQLQLSVFG